MAKLILRVGVALDDNAKSALQPLSAAMRQVRTTAQREGAAAGKAFSDPQARAAKETLRAMQEVGREGNRLYREHHRELERAARDRVRVEKAANAEIERDYKRLVAEMDRTAKQEARSAESAARARSKAGAKSARQTDVMLGQGLSAVVGLGSSALSFGARVAGDLARGAGIQTDWSQMISRGGEQEKTAQQIVTSGFMPGEAGPAGQLQSKQAILGEARMVSTMTGTDMNETLGALSSFVGKTGDLETGRKSLQDMAILARATGTNIEDMAKAAGEVSNNLEDGPDKAKTMMDVMRVIAQEGKLGAVEIKDLAAQMAKVASVAPKFEGDRAKTIGMFGAIAQEAKLRGGAATATQAATSVQAFTASMLTGSTIKQWQQHGLKPFANDDQTLLQSPDKLIRMAIQKADANGKGANIETLKALFPTEQAFRAVSGFANVYNDKGGGAAGLKALDDEFRKLADATLTAAEVQRAWSASMNTTEAKVAVFNSQMEQLGQQLASSLMPALEQMGPAILSTTQDIVNWVAHLTGADRGIVDKDVAGAGAIDAKGHADLLARSKTGGGQVTYGPFGMEVAPDTYNAEAVETIHNDVKTRGKAIGELEAQIEADKAAVNERTLTGANNRVHAGEKSVGGKIVGGLLNAATGGFMDIASTGAYLAEGPSEEEKAPRLAQLASDQKELAALTQAQNEQLATMKLVYTAISQGFAKLSEAVMAKNGPGAAAPKTTPAG